MECFGSCVVALWLTFFLLEHQLCLHREVVWRLFVAVILGRYEALGAFCPFLFNLKLPLYDDVATQECRVYKGGI
ncbi:uncharacterized protein EI90DRAFT_3055632, partial [Cantharellus anzutake]|uniref:uncharacterized protein n=1 Tax=Cantharellus anzutake TaxID=1750568 RepID=UPI001905A5B8